ncbi:MAG: DUF4395 domain-containing protein [Bacteroidota bacterium]|nr:MAG: DUF4395 domain-containing protein [Bacteroidota bacterium]
MKNIVCPISSERIPEHLPRITALFVISLLLIYVATGYTLILVFLLADFFARGFGYGRFSLLSHASRAFSDRFGFKSNLIDKAPKIFAARLGLVMIAAALLLALINIQSASFAIGAMLIFFAGLECVFNFCVGCYVYSLFVLPFFTKLND